VCRKEKRHYFEAVCGPIRNFFRVVRRKKRRFLVKTLKPKTKRKKGEIDEGRSKRRLGKEGGETTIPTGRGVRSGKIQKGQGNTESFPSRVGPEKKTKWKDRWVELMGVATPFIISADNVTLPKHSRMGRFSLAN